MDQSDKKLQIRVDLRGQHVDMFNEIKEKYAITTNTELVRFLITEVWNDQDATGGEVELHGELIQKIKAYLNRSDIRDDFHVYTVKEFVYKSLELFMEQLHSENRSILDWHVKAKLKDNELEIALAFAKCFRDNQDQGITSKQLAEFMNKRDVNGIERVLDNFVDQFLLNSIKRESGTIYFVD